jgi:hypothetical protein
MIPGRRGPCPVSYALRSSPLRSQTTIANPEASSPNSSMILRHWANRRARNCRASSRRRTFATVIKESGFGDVEFCHIVLSQIHRSTEQHCLRQTNVLGGSNSSGCAIATAKGRRDAPALPPRYQPAAARPLGGLARRVCRWLSAGLNVHGSRPILAAWQRNLSHPESQDCAR